MATVFAKQNGNWSDTTLWAFWNENTQQIEDYGQTPQVDDVVYCNSYEITFTGNLNIGNGTIHNDTNPYTMVGGGRLVVPNNNTNNNITANFKGANQVNILYINRSYVIKTVNITGNIEDCQIYIWGWNGTLNGNVTNSILSIQGYQQNVGAANVNLTINGNITEAINSTAIYNDTIANFYTYVHINGNVTINNGYLLDAASTTIRLYLNGNITNNYNNVLTTRNLNILALYGKYVSQYSKNITSGNITTFYISQNTQFQMTDENNVSFIMSAYPALPDYPAENDVKKDIPYAFNQMVGTYDINQYLPPESVVLKDYEYGDSDDRKTGIMEQEVNVEVGCVTPEDVRKDVPLVGMGVVGSLVVPSADDVREGVVFDNGSVGTLIVQGGGDRLRIADFGYYTNAQSDTYIVDLTEQDKPKFAVAEERVLIEMFPDLDLDNIPEKYFDDLFVKYLKYRLIVEYYRTAGINSTFTPSEPTTEIVNYQNVRNEVWLNSANIYLKAWLKKFPESITKPQRILL